MAVAVAPDVGVTVNVAVAVPDDTQVIGVGVARCVPLGVAVNRAGSLDKRIRPSSTS